MQTGELVTQRLKRTPSAAMRSMCGVSIEGVTQPSASARCWSVISKRMLGFMPVLLGDRNGARSRGLAARARNGRLSATEPRLQAKAAVLSATVLRRSP